MGIRFVLLSRLIFPSLSVVAVVLAAGCGGDYEQPPVATPLQTTPAQVTVAADVAPSVSAIVSPAGAVAPGSEIQLLVGLPAIVLGYNADGEITAVASDPTNAAILSLSANETAKTLVWLYMGGGAIKEGMAEVKARAAQTSQFANLVQAVATASATPEGVIQTAVLGEISAVITELRPSAAANYGTKAAAKAFVGQADFLPKPLTVYVTAKRHEPDNISNIVLANSGALEWNVSVGPIQGPPTISGMLPPSDGIISLVLPTARGEYLAGLNKGQQTVRIYQSDPTRSNNLAKMILDGMNLALSFLPFGEYPKEGFTCARNVLSALTNIGFDELVKKKPNEIAPLVKAFLSGLFTVTGMQNIVACAGKEAKNIDPTFLGKIAKVILGPVGKVADGIQLTYFTFTLSEYMKFAEEGAQVYVCVVKGAPVAESCDFDASLTAEFKETERVVPATIYRTIPTDPPMLAGIYCTAADELAGKRSLYLKGIAESRVAVGSVGSGEDLGSGVYDHETGTFTFTETFPPEVVLSDAHVTFFSSGTFNFSAQVDLKTGLISGTMTTTRKTSWTLDSTVRECRSSYSFEGGLALLN